MEQEEIDNILGNVQYLDAETLAGYIINGNIKLKQLMDTGELIPDKRIEIEAIIKKKEKEKEEEELNDWENARKSRNIDLVSQFIEKYPSGKYYNEAIILLDELIRIEGKKTEILDSIKNNPSIISRKELKEKYLDKNISIDDLREINVPNEIINLLDSPRKELKHDSLIDSDEDVFKKNEDITEVYFWGFNSSGKTCTLGAILSYGYKNVGISLITGGRSARYMNQLSILFSREATVLPPGTPLEVTHFLPFKIKDKRGDNHNVALFDLSGEIFKAFFKKSVGDTLEEEQAQTLTKVENLLKSKNKKIHFFVVDVARDPLEEDSEGVTTQQYLDSMKDYLEKNNIFKNNTDGIYILATKADVLSDNRSEWAEKAKEHLYEYYKSFMTSLKEAARKNKIIGKKDELTLYPFSIGKVFFKDLCLYNEKSSKTILKLLQEKTAKTRTGFWHSLKRKTKN